MTRPVRILLSLLALSLAFGLGRWSAPSPEPRVDVAAAPARLAESVASTAAPPEAAEADDDSSLIEYLMAANAALGERLRALGSVADAVGEARLSPTPLARAALRMIPERDVRGLLQASTSFTDEELDEIEDVRGFATRLLTIAADGTFDAESATSFAGDVHFGPSARSADDPQSTFAPSQGRIYAFFDDPGYQGDQVVARWYNRSTGTLMLMDRYEIRAGRPGEYVWGRASGDWEPGEYQVEFYSSDEALTPLASGRFRIDEGVADSSRRPGAPFEG